MSLRERLMLSEKRVDYKQSVKSYNQSWKNISFETAIKNAGHSTIYWGEVSELDFIALESYLAEAFDVTREYALKCLNASYDYFYGEWRDVIPAGDRRELPPDRNFQDKVLLWEDEWRSCLLWCSVLGEWDRLLEFANYMHDETGILLDNKSEGRAWLLLVAGKLRGRPREELQQYSETILGGRRKREKLLLDLFEAILEAASVIDEEPDNEEIANDINSAFKRYATYYKTAEFPKEDLTLKVAYDASFLVHYAEYLDLPIEVPEKMADHIVRLP